MSLALRILLVAALVPTLLPGAAAVLEGDVCVTVNPTRVPPSVSVSPGCLPPIESSPLPVKVWVEGVPLP